MNQMKKIFRLGKSVFHCLAMKIRFPFLIFNRLCSDREIIKDSTDLHSRLFDLSKMNHIIIQFNDRGYLYGEFTRQISKLKLKITDLERISNDVPRDAELLEAK